MFLPMERSQDRTKEQRVQHFQEVFGDGKMNEKSIQAFAEAKLYIPSDKNEATIQLGTAIKFLDLVTGKKSIASDGYRYGLQIVQEHGRKFVREIQNDRLFMIKYLYLLDCVFQSFCELLVTTATGKDPLGEAHKRGLHLFMRQELDRELRSFLMIGSPPNLALPQVLVHKKRKETESPENKRGFPKVTHHRTKKKVYPCLKHLCTGECSRGLSCNLSHFKTELLEPEESAKIDDRLAAVFTSS